MLAYVHSDQDIGIYGGISKKGEIGLGLALIGVFCIVFGVGQAGLVGVDW